MPKLPDDMSDEAIQKRAALSKQTRAVARANVEPPTAEEIAAFKAKMGLDDDAVVFMCRRGRR